MNDQALKRIAFLLAGGLALAAAPALAQVGVSTRTNDRMIVTLTEGTDLAEFVDAFAMDHPDVGLAGVDQVPDRPMHLLEVEYPDGADPDALADAIEVMLEEAYPFLLENGEFLYDNSAPEGHTGSTYVDGLDLSGFDNQYAADQIGLAGALAHSTGAGIVVAVVDTGVDATHPRLASRIVSGGFDFVDADDDPADHSDGFDQDQDGLTDEMAGHGTFVAGLLSLVAPDARLLPVRVLNDEGHGDAWILARGVFHAIDHGVEIINLSLGSTYKSEILELAFDEAESKGIVVVAAAGNLDRDEPEEHPAMSDAFGVAALDQFDVKASFSNFGKDLLISAPGVSTPAQPIVSTIPGGGYGAWEGTSFATPFVSGTVALIRAQHPEWDLVAGSGEYIVSAVEDALETGAFDVYDVNPAYADDAELGAGRLDAGASVALAPAAPDPGDLDADGVIGFADLVLLLADWGRTHTPSDLDGNGDVGFGDVVVLLARWS